MKYVAPSGPLSIGGVLDNWLRLFRASFAACWPLALLGAVAGVLLELSITPNLPPQGSAALQNYLHYWSSFRAPVTILTYIFFWFVSLVVYGALLAQQTALVRGGETFSFGDALVQGLRRVPQMVLGGILIVLIVMAIGIPVGIGAAVGMPLLRRSPLAILTVMLAVLAAVIVFIYVMARLQLWMAVMFSEDLGGASSLGRSWDLVKGQWWRVTGVTFVSGIIIWILSAAIGGVGGLVIGIMGIHGSSPEEMLRRMQLISAAGQVVQLLSMPLLTAVWLAVYQDVRLRREGGDLAARTEALSGN
ncbi:MAG TPA: hypothetical protein VMA54_07040 [Steroidobacteraceae bacterium]|nr:hypothetical protein [Steroidobacteraceae bacterium]